MAYADTINRPNASSLGAAIATNALLIAGIIFAAPHISRDAEPTAISLTNFAPPTPDKPKTDPHIETPASGQKTAPEQPLKPAVSRTQAASNNDVTQIGSGTITDFTGDGFPPVIEERIEPTPPVIIFREATINPRFRSAFQPEYPPELIRQEIEGAVTIRVLIGADGRVRQVEPLRFDDAYLLRVTQAHALKKWRFLPATRDGVPVESWREMTVRFEIPD